MISPRAWRREQEVAQSLFALQTLSQAPPLFYYMRRAYTHLRGAARIFTRLHKKCAVDNRALLCSPLRSHWSQQHAASSLHDRRAPWSWRRLLFLSLPVGVFIGAVLSLRSGTEEDCSVHVPSRGTAPPVMLVNMLPTL